MKISILLTGAKALLAVAAVFFLTFGLTAPFFSRLGELFVSSASRAAEGSAFASGAGLEIIRMITEGILPGVISVLSFVPSIALLFFCLSLLGESPILRELSIISDPLMRRFGLSGEALPALIMGFGCAVPAIASAGALRERSPGLRAILLIPLMPCGAKLPVCVLLCSSLFPGREGAALILLLLCDTAALLLMAAVLKRLAPKASPPPAFTPPFGPASAITASSLREAFRCALKSALDFVKKAFTVILAASAVCWLLENLGPGFEKASSPNESLLAHLGSFISPLFAPLGFGDWRAAAAIISGLSAKEAVAGTLSVLTEGSGASVSEIFTPPSGFSFLLFCILYIPCLPSLIAMKKQTGSLSVTALSVCLEFSLAWLLSFGAYRAAVLIFSFF